MVFPTTTTTDGPVMRPAYLGDAGLGDRIRFRLPNPDTGTIDTYEGDLWAYERDRHAVGFPMVRFRLGGMVGREFRCRPDLHVELAPKGTP